VLESALADEKLDRAARAETHYKLGRVLSRQGRVVESVEQLRRSVALVPDAANAQLLLGQLYFERKDYDRALGAFEQYLKDAPRAENAAKIRELVGKLKAQARNH